MKTIGPDTKSDKGWAKAGATREVHLWVTKMVPGSSGSHTPGLTKSVRH